MHHPWPQFPQLSNGMLEEATCQVLGLTGLTLRGCRAGTGGGGKITKDTIKVAMAALPRLHPHRLNLRKSRLLTRAAKGFLNKPLTKASESSPGSQSFDYVPLVSAPDPSHSTEGSSREPLPVLLQEREKDLDLPAQGQQGTEVCVSLPPRV